MNWTKYIMLFLSMVVMGSCSNDIDSNINPNQPGSVTTPTIMMGAQKKMMDYIFDSWFSGRQGLPYAQYWSQRNYTEEDRYQVRESVNNSYFYDLYTIANNYQHIIELNTQAESRAESAIYGANSNQIAASRILKAYMFHIMTDIWGAIPYSEALKVESNKTPQYDKQQDIYDDLLKELTEAVEMIDEDEAVLTSGDMIYNGDATKWKKFGNSLKCRIAIRLSKVDPKWKTYIQEALASGVFESNDDNAGFKYSKTDPNQCAFYRSFFVSNRNDFSITKTLVDFLKGQSDTLNNKHHPWEGVVDPRLSIYTTSRDGKYIGIPYGVASANMTTAIRNAAPNWYAYPPLALEPDFTVNLMSYAELCFILSEYEGYSKGQFENGVTASLSYWSILNGRELNSNEIDNYVSKVNANINAETLALQKFLDLYMNGYEAWAEYRRTGFPSLLKPGEITHVVYDSKTGLTNTYNFVALVEVKGDIAARVKYPTIESTLNGANFEKAVSLLKDGTNNQYSKMFWDVRDANGVAPANK